VLEAVVRGHDGTPDRDAMARKISAGTVLFRSLGKTLEILLVHPKGWVHERTPWGIPKGFPREGETLEDAARRETWEETGVVPRALVAVGAVRYRRTQKTVFAFVGPGPLEEPRCASHEIDGARYFPIEEARARIHPDQEPLLDRLLALLHAVTPCAQSLDAPLRRPRSPRSSAVGVGMCVVGGALETTEAGHHRSWTDARGANGEHRP